MRIWSLFIFLIVVAAILWQSLLFAASQLNDTYDSNLSIYQICRNNGGFPTGSIGGGDNPFRCLATSPERKYL